MRLFLKTLLVLTFFSIMGGQSMAESGADNVFIKIEFSVKSSQKTDFMGIMSTLNSGMKTEPGFILAMVYVDVEDSEKITLIEKWETRKHHEDHYQEIVKNGSWQGILEMLTTEPEMRYVGEIQVH